MRSWSNTNTKRNWYISFF